MIDYDTYRKLHPDADDFSKAVGVTMWASEMNKDDPPEDNRKYIFPSTITGFSMQDKKWSRSSSCHSDDDLLIRH